MSFSRVNVYGVVNRG